MNLKRFFRTLFLLFFIGTGSQFLTGQTTCTDPTFSYQFDNGSTNDDCCWFINITNQSVSNQITAVEIDNLIDCEIGSLTANNNWTVSNVTNSSGIVLPNTSYIQPGTYNQRFKVCLDNRTNYLQYIDVSFLESDNMGGYQKYCTTTFAFDCPMSTNTTCTVNACYTVPPWTGTTTRTFDASCSTGNGTLSHLWDFGDGNTGTGTITTHTYTSNQPWYIVNLYTTNTINNLTCTDTATFTIDSPWNPDTLCTVNACFNVSPWNGTTTRTFDASCSTGNGTLSYFWNFGDGNTGTGINPTHTYTSNQSTYNIKLTTTNTTNNTSCTDSTNFIIDSPVNNDTLCTVNACFAPAYQSGNGFIFYANCSSGNGNLSYAWDFGDGNTGTGISPFHTYASPQTIYNVCLFTTNTINGSSCVDTICQQVETPISNDTCDLQVNLPLTISFCDDETVTLTPMISGGTGTLTYSWSPATNLSDPTILSPIANPSVVTTYTLTVSDIMGCSDTAQVTVQPIVCPCDNLVVNGDFEDGDVDFNSDLPSSCVCQVGSYCVTTNAKNKCASNLWNGILAPGGTGNYMVVDGVKLDIWSQNITVNAGAIYEFCFDYFPNVSDGGTPELIVEIFLGATPIATLGSTTGTSGSWQTICFPSWTSTVSGAIELVIRQVDSPVYSDYGIDNIQFGSCCELSLSEPDTLDICINQSTQLNPTVSGANGPVTYSWTPTTGLSDPTILNPIATPTVPTTYTLTATDSTGCEASTMISVIPIICDCENLVINGDFESGNIGFTSSLPNDCSCQAASYCITSDAKNKCANSLWNSILAPGGSGDYLVVDGANGLIWAQEVDVTVGETYNFCFDYFPNISDGGTPELGINIYHNNMLVHTLGNTMGTSGNWQNICFPGWLASLTGTVELQIYQYTSPTFSDYGIDNIYFSCDSIPVGFKEELSLTTSVKIYPNPTTDVVTLKLGENLQNDLQYQLINVLGRQITVGTINRGTINHQLDLSELQDGIYLLLIGNTQEGYTTERIVKKR